jgi:hypothetical protein
MAKFIARVFVPKYIELEAENEQEAQQKAQEWYSPGSRGSGCVRGFLLRRNSSLCHHPTLTAASTFWRVSGEGFD